ncbi:lipocalin family protein [Williamsia sterculiae]|uniref:Apolipoprotein D and lipocalin family protein n=1 Tax=Williamsia sterculiae TaxID=1344003 RepID=A0A1N7FLH4_9NOCA|nr:lipocalin family protein [Williamsia sterculiae]SIS01199.1 apolipoprotein D and lipocalin family protein [Williamsia sterculiae]
MRRIATVVLLGLLTALGVSTATATGAPGYQFLQPIPKLDAQRYLGAWNQVAAVPQPFNLECARDTVATYGLVDKTDISVRNRCTRYNGTRSGIDGNARVVDTRTGAQLHVSFPGVPFQDSKTGPPNYIVTYIAPDYSWALVGDPIRVSGFVLSRSATVSAAQWRTIRSVIRSRGYSDCLFLTSPTSVPGGVIGIRPLCTL